MNAEEIRPTDKTKVTKISEVEFRRIHAGLMDAKDPLICRKKDDDSSDKIILAVLTF